MPFAGSPGAYCYCSQMACTCGGQRTMSRRRLNGSAAPRFPRVETLAVRYVLNPPTEAESLAMLAGAESRG